MQHARERLEHARHSEDVEFKFDVIIYVLGVLMANIGDIEGAETQTEADVQQLQTDVSGQIADVQAKIADLTGQVTALQGQQPDPATVQQIVDGLNGVHSNLSQLDAAVKGSDPGATAAPAPPTPPATGGGAPVA